MADHRPKEEEEMPKIVLTGRVLPAAISVNVDGLGTINWKSPDIELEMAFDIRIKNSVVTIECETNRFTPPDDVQEIWRRAFDLTRAAVDLIAFAQGRGLTVLIETLTDPTGVTSNIVAEDAALGTLVTAIQLEKNFLEIWKIVATNPALFQALNDLVAGIALPHQAAVNCARVVEGLSHLIGGVGADAKARWKALREALNLDRTYVQPITDVSTDPRHGNRTHIPGGVLRPITTRSWVIMDRFLEYRRRGGAPLREPEFPLLKG